MTQVNQQRVSDGGAYTFASQPKSMKNRKKYRDPLEADTDKTQAGNIMWDKRIIRGSTHALKVLPASGQPDPIEMQRQQEAKRRAIARRRAKQQMRQKSPEPIEGRLHNAVQTALYIEELTDRVEEADVECQTDAFLDRPASPLFIPAKSGQDRETQIYKDDLFDFNLESKPVLEVLVGKTIEQSLLEVMEEEELANLRMQQREFEELRNVELVEMQRLEEKERRHREEKERRQQQMKDVALKEKETSDKIAAKAFSQSYMGDLVQAVYDTLRGAGYFYDAVERDCEQNFMPWLMEQSSDELVRQVQGRIVLDGMIREVVEITDEAYEAQIDIAERYAQYVLERTQTLEKKESEEAHNSEETQETQE